jgi:hypothetical protein
MRGLKIGVVALLILIVGGVLYLTTSSGSGTLNSEIKIITKIENECSENLENELNISSATHGGSECVESKLTAVAGYADPEDLAVALFSVYGSEGHTLINSACHLISHSLGYMKASMSDSSIKRELDELQGCMYGFLHGYSEYPMRSAGLEELLEQGIEPCVNQLLSYADPYNCAHTYGHLLYDNLNAELNPVEIAKECTRFEEWAEQACINGIFMEYFAEESTYLSTTNNGKELNANSVLQLCTTNSQPAVARSCVAGAWPVLYRLSLANSSEDSVYLKFGEICKTISEDLAYYCGMALAFPIVKQYTYNVDTSIGECVKAGDGNDLITSGCLSWGGRLMWRDTRNYDYFIKMCSNKNNVKRGSCLVQDYENPGEQGGLTWEKLKNITK